MISTAFAVPNNPIMDMTTGASSITLSQLPEKPVLPCILGPTGSGKTAVSLAVAAASSRPAAIVNLDSRQVYADFPIITAQPSAQDKRAFAHHLYGFLPTTRKLGAGEFARLARAVIDRIFSSGGLPILVGGTGLYLKALLGGLAPIPQVPAEISRYWQDQLDRKGSPALHRILGDHDPNYAGKIHPNDRQRVLRALEVWQATGKPLSRWHAEQEAESPYRPVKIGLDVSLARLEPILSGRIDSMLAEGALQEAATALAASPDARAPGWSGIGCAELLRHLRGELSLEACLDLWRKNTRAYAKRQLTWFRADPDISWFPPSAIPEILSRLGPVL